MMGKPTDVRVMGVALYFLPVETRVPLKFGKETVTYGACARARVKVEGADGKTACGWGETPLSVTWIGFVPAFLVMILTTPPMASDPYKTEAGPFIISILSV